MLPTLKAILSTATPETYDQLEAFLNKNPGTPLEDPSGLTAFHLATLLKDPRLIVRLCLHVSNAGPIVNRWHPEYGTALQLGTESYGKAPDPQMLACLEKLCERGAIPNAAPSGKATSVQAAYPPLILAAQLGNPTLIDLFCQYGGDLRLRFLGANAWHYAIHHEHLPLVQHLLAKDPLLLESTTAQGETGVHLAARLPLSCGVLSFLLEAKANAVATNHAAQTPLEAAESLLQKSRQFTPAAAKQAQRLQETLPPVIALLRQRPS